MSIAEIALRIFWFAVVLNERTKVAPALTMICWLPGLVLGGIANFFAPGIFNHITFWGGGLVGFLICGNDDPLPAIASLFISGWIFGQIAGLLLHLLF